VGKKKGGGKRGGKVLLKAGTCGDCLVGRPTEGKGGRVRWGEKNEGCADLAATARKFFSSLFCKGRKKEIVFQEDYSTCTVNGDDVQEVYLAEGKGRKGFSCVSGTGTGNGRKNHRLM